MTTLYRCELCHEIIDPVEGEQRTQMHVAIEREDETGDSAESVDFCEECAPQGAGPIIDWMLHKMEER